MTKNTSHHAEPQHIEDVSLADLKRREARALELLAELQALYPGLVTLTEDERRHSPGRMRTGEDRALLATLDVADRYPERFAGLADKDYGQDPGRFETAPLRDLIARREVLDRVATVLSPLATAMNDTLLHLGERIRGLGLPTYQIAKSNAQQDEKVRQMLAPALDFFALPARRGAQTRAEKKLPKVP